MQQERKLNLNLNKRIPAVFHILQNYDLDLIFQEIGKYNFKINVIPKTIEKYMSFTIQQPKEKGNKPVLQLVFTVSIHFLNNSLDNLVKNFGEKGFYHLSQEFNANVLVSKSFLFGLDLAHYLSTPGYSWDAMLRFTDANLKLISDIEMYQFVESTITGGISMICKGQCLK